MFTFYLNSNIQNFFSFHGGYFAKHHNLSSFWKRIFGSGCRGRNIRLLSISKFFVDCRHSSS